MTEDKLLKKTKNKPKIRTRPVRFCPKCGSTDIWWARGLPHLWSIWECRNCGYYGAFILEDGKLSKKLQQEYSRKRQETEEEKLASHQQQGTC